MSKSSSFAKWKLTSLGRDHVNQGKCKRIYCSLECNEGYTDRLGEEEDYKSDIQYRPDCCSLKRGRTRQDTVLADDRAQESLMD